MKLRYRSINQGIGSIIFQDIEQFANNNHAIAFQCGIRETRSADILWLENRGFIQTLHTFESQLDLSSYKVKQDYNFLEGVDGSGIRFTSFAEYPHDDKWLSRFLHFWWSLAKDAPGMEGKTQPDFELMKKLFEDIDREGFILAVDGEKWVAMSIIIKETDDVCYNSLTGVHRDYRGKKLAIKVKLKAIEYAIQKGTKFIRTHNDSNNTPMLNVNQKLGYEKKPGLYGLEKRM